MGNWQLSIYYISLLPESHREAESSNKDLTRQVNELILVRNGLQGDKDSLSNDLGDAHETIRDLQARLDSANSALNQLKQETDNRIRERDEEIENIKYVANINGSIRTYPPSDPTWIRPMCCSVQ